MIKYGLKLWTNDSNFFDESISLFKEGRFDFLELYHNAQEKFDLRDIEKLKKIPVTIHAFHNGGFHDFIFEKKELETWNKTKELADFFHSQNIIVHAGKAKNIENFQDNLKKINDPRILIENMAGLDIYGDFTFGYKFEELKEINKSKKICFDFEKAVKSACYQGTDYKEFIKQSLNELQPNYFHISGGNKNTEIDEHLNLQEANFDLKWIKNKLQKISKEKDIFLVFEVPKNEADLKNDIKNMNYFRNL